MDINSSTVLYGIFGHPVLHSFSPSMHNAAFGRLAINAVYLAFDILPENLGFAVDSIKQLDVKGVNVTIPHKQEIIEYLDEISSEAQHTGAVNTIKNTDGYLFGHNTDVGGFLKALEVDLDLKDFHDRSALLIGAGGAARSVLSGLCMRGIKDIAIFNRSLDNAVKLSEYFGEQFKDVSIKSYELSDCENLTKFLAQADLLINSSSAGMKGHDDLDIPIKYLKRNSYVYDLVYNPRETLLVKDALSLGHKATTGLGMLIYQGAESFEIWTGEKAPVQIMREALFDK